VRKLLRYAAMLVPGVAWTVPLFTQLHKRYPCLGTTALHGLGLGLLLAAACAAVFFATGGPHLRRRGSPALAYAGIVVASIVSGTLWAPCLNALLDFGPKATIDGEVEEISNPGKGNPNRRVIAEVDGEKREGTFYAHDNFWHVPAVREGGSVRLTVGPGLFGVPWIARFEGR